MSPFAKAAAALLLVAFLSIAFLPRAATAHSPSGMTLSYDAESGILSVAITHQVADPNSHYVVRVEIKKNGASYLEQAYSAQPTNSIFEYNYNLTVEPGDLVEVSAFCVIGGSITRSIEISGSSGPSPVGGTPVISWPFHAVLMVLGFVLLLTGALVARYMKKRSGWLKVHKAAQILGSALALVGVILGVYMVSITTGQHFRVPHAFVATIAAILILANISLGYLQFREGSNLRVVHRWVGRAVLILLLINIMLGLSLVGIL